MPLVGEAGRSVRSGDILPCVGDMASPRTDPTWSTPSGDDPCSEGGANFCESSTGRGDRTFAGSASPPDMDVFEEKRLLKAALPRTELAREGELERMLSGGGLDTSGSAVDSRDIPGSCFLPDSEPTSEGLSS